MKKGILIFAHNNREIDYALLSIISAGLAKKHLKVPASLVTDKSTIEWMWKSKIFEKAETVFENIIEVERPVSSNTRILSDGFTTKTVPFTNNNRFKAFDLTPYDRTLLLDSDYLIFTDKLSKYWDVNNSVMISSAINEVIGDRVGFADIWVSETSIPLYWATTVMFSKNEESKIFFDLVDFIAKNYKHYADIFRYNPNQYRNDISFSIAKHIMYGYETHRNLDLPPVLTVYDRDQIYSVDDNKIRFILNTMSDQSYLALVSNLDIHIMNKQSIIRNADKFLEMI